MAPTKTNRLNSSKAKELREKKAAYKLLNTVLDKMKNLDSPVAQEMIKYKDELGRETGLGLPIEERLHAFLIKNDLPAFVFPKITTLAEHAGGYSLVREIATKHGGMKKVKTLYAQKYRLNTKTETLQDFILAHGLPCWDEEELIA